MLLCLVGTQEGVSDLVGNWRKEDQEIPQAAVMQVGLKRFNCKTFPAHSTQLLAQRHSVDQRRPPRSHLHDDPSRPVSSAILLPPCSCQRDQQVQANLPISDGKRRQQGSGVAHPRSASCTPLVA